MISRLSIAMALLSSAGAAAQTPQAPPQASADSTYPTVSVGVLTYIQYDAELINRDGYNAFDITRGYVNISGIVSKHVRFRMTPDVRRVTDGSLSGSLAFRMKYAFAEFDDVLGRGSWVRIGLHQTPWLDFEESINRYRVQGPMFAEREGVIPGSADFGAGVSTPLPGGYGEINAGVYNGEGFGSGEINRDKSVQARATIRPFPRMRLAKGLRVSGFYDAGWYAAGYPRRHGIAMASFEHPHLAATAQWLSGTDRPLTRATDAHVQGASAFVELRQGQAGWAVFARTDHFDPDTAVSDNSDRRLIAGTAYWLLWAKTRVGLVFDGEGVRYDRARQRPNEKRILFQMQVQF